MRPLTLLWLCGAARALVAPSTPRSSPTRHVALRAASPAFAEPLWGRTEFDAVDEASETVKCTVYDIGGSLTAVLSATCSKQLPMIPHVGVRIYGTEYFYSDMIESRPVEVMAEMLESFPQVTFDLGPPTVGEAELKQWLESDELQADWQPESYNVFDHNCNHFAKVISDKVTDRGLDDALMRPLLDVTEKMLSELPEWRKSLGMGFMNQITRLVVVSWGRATRKKKKELEDAAKAAAAQ
mmetsp:Transcript_21824/g.67190  ORF Transcript_21824/g.67190 Transcript_21824/m.67190 type:complete len:240 (+) Transcript_21824:106-825(+)